MELRDTLNDISDLEIVWVMADNQINAKTERFIDELGLRGRVHFWSDAESASIDRLGLRKDSPEPIEQGVPHPTTYVLDRTGTIRFADVRRDYQLWLDPQLLKTVLSEIP